VGLGRGFVGPACGGARLLIQVRDDLLDDRSLQDWNMEFRPAFKLTAGLKIILLTAGIWVWFGRQRPI